MAEERRGEERNGRKGETAPERRITYREIWLERPLEEDGQDQEKEREG